MLHFPEEERESRRGDIVCLQSFIYLLAELGFRAGLLILRPDRIIDEELMFGFSWNIGTDLD